MKSLSALSLVAMILGSTSAFAVGINLDTNPAGLTDNSTGSSNGWHVFSTPGFIDGAPSGEVGDPVAIASHPVWVAAPEGAGWIASGADFGLIEGAQANASGQRPNPGLYEFRRSFALALPQATLSFQVAADNTVTVNAVCVSGGCGAFSYSYIHGADALGFLALSPGQTISDLPSGDYELRVVVENGRRSNGAFEPNQTGLLFIGSVEMAPVPEPSTWAMLAAGIGLAGWRVRRHGRCAS